MEDLYQELHLRMTQMVHPLLADAWIAFLSGDHPKLMSCVKQLDTLSLTHPYDLSSRYGLLAFYNNLLGQPGGLEHAEKALQVLPENDHSIIAANAHLTLGQFCAGLSQLRKAVQHFHQAASCFDESSFDFPAIVSLTNEALNTFRMGELTKTESICTTRLIQSAIFAGQSCHFSAILKLPLGLCEYARGRFALSAEHLAEALACINHLGMLHMHGLVEQTLFAAKLASGDIQGAKAVSDTFEQRFRAMASPYLNLLMTWFRLRLALVSDEPVSASDVERCQKELEKTPEQVAPLAIDGALRTRPSILMALPLLLPARLKHFRFIGDRIAEMDTLVAMAALNELTGNHKDAAQCFHEADAIRAETGISYTPYPILSEESASVSSTTPILTGLLSAREIDILKAVCSGMSNAEIGKVHYISVATVKWHLHNIFGKLQIENRVQALSKARELGLL